MPVPTGYTLDAPAGNLPPGYKLDTPDTQQQGFFSSFGDQNAIVQGAKMLGHAVMHPADTIQALSHAGNPFDPQNPIAQAVTGTAQNTVDNIRQGVQDYRQQGLSQQTRRDFGRAVPVVGPALAKAQGQYDAGNGAGAAGTIAGVVSNAITPGNLKDGALKLKAGASSVADTFAKPAATVSEAIQSAKNAATAGPQSSVMPSAAKLPLVAQSGVEDIFRAAAPTGKNIGFRENLNVVAPDLADIARKIDISEAKGGIINPDMRVRATVDAIRSHLDEMYQNERAPQIERNAQLPVKVGTNPNAVRGLEYLEGTAGDVADSQLARKALDGETLTVAEADKLAKVANQTLLSFERMTPEGKMQIQTTNPKVGGLKALDSDLSGNLNDVLMANGEKGLYSYERRYAGLSAVLDQLQTRMNATELKQEGVFGAVGRYTRPALKVIKEGPSGVPSASQAAVSDVNIGRTLQTGLKKLKSSGITSGSQ